MIGKLTVVTATPMNSLLSFLCFVLLVALKNDELGMRNETADLKLSHTAGKAPGFRLSKNF